jgi:4-phospho-D-threonate 3-dehydrogenase / 4-phospho-D-erythronate 3-dehydrogenase
MGDPAGIGPEIIVKALAELRAPRGGLSFVPVIYGVPSAFRNAAATHELPFNSAVVSVGEPATPIAVATISAEAGRLAYLSIERAVKDAMTGNILAMVTAPISKEAINLAGHAYAGHTDMLADLTGSVDSCMMLAHGAFRVSHVSTHVALRKVPDLVTPMRITRVVELTMAALARLGIAKPRIAVAALNPHAGEGGLFGDEDATVIVPTVQALRERGLEVSGPISGDTVFVRALGNEFDAVIAMYHDQGHIPVKLLGFHVDPVSRQWTTLQGVNITLGLPFVRTSVDHGTAFDIAGKNKASAQSMVEAIEFALNLAG